jgi:hypothetical protein
MFPELLRQLKYYSVDGMDECDDYMEMLDPAQSY